jgi:glycerophosphoryl diester phosphodiesterase
MEAPENTLPAYIKAWSQGVDAVELDVRETKDKRLICIHDDSLARVSESEYTISQETLDSLKTVDIGTSHSKKFANTHIPQLKEAFDCKPKKSKIFIEIKPSKISFNELDELIATNVISKLNAHFLGFYPNVVRDLIKRFDIPATLSIIPAFFDYDYEKISALLEKSKSFGISQHIDSKKSMNLIKKFKEDGKYCIAWTVNNKKYMRDLIELGTDAIITDNPKKLMKVIKEKRNG